MAPTYTIFEGERAQKKRDFLSKFSKKCPKSFFASFFKNLPVAQKILPKQRLFTALRELGKSIGST